jgi:hypothetical protein
MCIDPPGKRLQRFAVCSCGAYFPECDLTDFLDHGISKGASNHQWVLVHAEWKGFLEWSQHLSD